MNKTLLALAIGLLVAAGPASAISKKQVVASQDRYDKSNWMVAIQGGMGTNLSSNPKSGSPAIWGLSVWNRKWEKSGLGIDLVEMSAGYKASGYSYQGYLFTYFHLIPSVLKIGQMGWAAYGGLATSDYTTSVNGIANTTLASGWGGTTGAMLFFSFPTTRLLGAEPETFWSKLLDVDLFFRLGCRLAYIPLKTKKTTDLDGDGVNEYVRGRGFTDPAGINRRARDFFFTGGSISVGLSWFF